MHPFSTVKHNQLEVGHSVPSYVFYETNINLQERIDAGILEIKGDVSLLQQYHLTLPLLLKLARYYPVPEKERFHWVSLTIEKSLLTIHLQSREFSELKVQFDFDAMTVDNMQCYTSGGYKNTGGIVYKGFVQQVLLAKELGFRYIYGLGGGSAVIKKESKERNMGYSYRFKLGFLHDEEVNSCSGEIFKIIKKAQHQGIRNCSSLNKLLLLQDEEGERIGLAYWDTYGIGVDMVFDLSEHSASMEILKKYVTQKQFENPEKYGDVYL